MNRSQPTVAVVGSGLAAHVAAAAAAEAGVDVVRYRGDAPGIAGIWNGLGAIFGPPSAPLSDSAGAVEQRAPDARPFDPSPGHRWRRLAERRGRFHPYRRLRLDRPDVDAAVESALAYLPGGAICRIDAGRVLPGPHGQPAAPDLVFPSLAALDFADGDRIGCVRCPDLNGWDAEATARQLDRAEGLDVEPVDWERLADAPPGHSVRVAHWFDDLVGERASELLAGLDRLVDRRDLDVLLLPPIVAARLDRHRDLWRRIEETTDATVAEFPTATDPVFGWRLDRACRDRSTASAVRRRPAAETIELSGRCAEAVADEEGETHPCDAVIVATGRWFGGGVPGRAPMVEPLTGAPIWLDGAPLSNDEELYPPDFLEAFPWSDHPLFRTGLQVDDRGRILDRDGHPFDNVFAAGRVLGGFNPFADGCSFGVELATGLAAGRRSTDAIDEPSVRRTDSDSLPPR